jgi:hypothetical protein
MDGMAGEELELEKLRREKAEREAQARADASAKRLAAMLARDHRVRTR